jgi:hypothetical protein
LEVLTRFGGSEEKERRGEGRFSESAPTSGTCSATLQGGILIFLRWGHGRHLRGTLGLAEQIHDEAVGTWDACGKLAEKGEAGINVNAFAVVREDERA